tara:strand:+ start:123 stop:230 length:108 start_codon:yes stop_codon:yes gene_type:complete
MLSSGNIFPKIVKYKNRNKINWNQILLKTLMHPPN